jgi:hypothetical protein
LLFSDYTMEGESPTNAAPLTSPNAITYTGNVCIRFLPKELT